MTEPYMTSSNTAGILVWHAFVSVTHAYIDRVFEMGFKSVKVNGKMFREAEPAKASVRDFFSVFETADERLYYLNTNENVIEFKLAHIFESAGSWSRFFGREVS